MFYSSSSNVLIYENPPESLLQTIPDARPINGHYAAVPAHLGNLQVLRRLNLPVIPPMDRDYDWPIQRGLTPLPHQKVMANFMALHPRCFNLSDMGCVGGETLVDTAAGPIAIAELAERGLPINVRTLTDFGPRFVKIDAPFAKGRARLYRVVFKSGRQIVVTARHVFLSSRGWISCGSLKIGEQLPVFDVYPQQSSWAPSPLEFQPDVRHWNQTALDFLDRWRTRSHDGQPLQEEDTAQALAPWSVDALKRIRAAWQTGAPGSEYTSTDLPEFDLPSMTRYEARIDQGEMGAFLSECATTQRDNQFRISVRYHLSPNLLREALEGPVLQLCIPLNEASAAPFDTVTHIAYEREDVYYDMHVPRHENYIAHGVCSHNTMKTLASLWAADYIMSHYPPGECRFLIVSTVSSLHTTWADAIFQNFLGRRTCVVLHGTAEKRQQLLARPADFYIINYDGVGTGASTARKIVLKGFSADLAARTDIKGAIVDECRAYHNVSTSRHAIARLLIKPRDYLWMMTGTPTPQGPIDAYGQAKLVNGAYGETLTSYKGRVMMQLSQFKWVPRAGANEEAKKLLSPAVRFKISDCVDLPPCITQARDVEMSAEQAKAYKDFKKDLVLQVKGGMRITAMNEGSLRTKLIQIACGAIYDQNHVAHLIDASPRISVLREVIDQCQEKVIIFAPLTSVVNMLNMMLKEYSRAVVNGETTFNARKEIFRAFQQDANPRLIIADPGTMAHSLTLTAASTIIWYAPPERTETYLQANKRIDRPGQTKTTNIVQLAATPVEREIFKRLAANQSLQGVLLRLAEER